MGGNNKLSYSGNYSLIYRTEDSATPYIIASNPRFNTSSFQRIELGIERTLGLKRFDVILGADLNFGHEYYSQLSAIDKAGEAYYPKNDIPYYRLIAVDSEAYGSINSLETTLNYFSVGLGLQGGAKFDLFSNLYFTVLTNIRMDAEFIVNEKNEYRNELYKEHLTLRETYSIFNIYLGVRMGLHYRF